MKIEAVKLSNRIVVVVTDGEIKRGAIVLDPTHHVNEVKQVWHKDKTVKFVDGNGTYLRSVKKIEEIIIDGINILI